MQLCGTNEALVAHLWQANVVLVLLRWWRGRLGNWHNKLSIPKGNESSNPYFFGRYVSFRKGSKVQGISQMVPCLIISIRIPDLILPFKPSKIDLPFLHMQGLSWLGSTSQSWWQGTTKSRQPPSLTMSSSPFSGSFKVTVLGHTCNHFGPRSGGIQRKNWAFFMATSGGLFVNFISEFSNFDFIFVVLDWARRIFCSILSWQWKC